MELIAEQDTLLSNLKEIYYMRTNECEKQWARDQEEVIFEKKGSSHKNIDSFSCLLCQKIVQREETSSY